MVIPFDFNRFHDNGVTVKTRGGKSVKAVYFIREAKPDQKIVWVQEDGKLQSCGLDGQFLLTRESYLDLVMEVEI
jgi:hypothetical protein